MILFQMGGALNTLGSDHSPVGNRDARFILNIGGSWEQAADDASNIAWVRETWTELKPFSTGGTYLNFLTEDDGVERTQAALGTAMGRLAEIKAKWDPDNFFRTNRNVGAKAT
jgi:hypothetical protein